MRDEKKCAYKGGKVEHAHAPVVGSNVHSGADSSQTLLNVLCNWRDEESAVEYLGRKSFYRGPFPCYCTLLASLSLSWTYVAKNKQERGLNLRRLGHSDERRGNQDGVTSEHCW